MSDLTQTMTSPLGQDHFAFPHPKQDVPTPVGQVQAFSCAANTPNACDKNYSEIFSAGDIFGNQYFLDVLPAWHPFKL